MSGLFEHLPEPPAWAFDWDALFGAYAWLRAMPETPQDPVHHAEGDVWIHTRMVCEAMRGLAAWEAAPEREKAALLAAALLHDVAKPATTRREGERVTARGHSTRGEVMARTILWELDVAPSARETGPDRPAAHRGQDRPPRRGGRARARPRAATR